MTIAPEQAATGADEPVADDTGSATRRSAIGRVLDPVTATTRSWTAHAALIGVVLGGLLAWINNGQVTDADEGALMAQLQTLSHGHWGLPLTSALDPTGRWFPIHLSETVGKVAYPFTRPPIYPAILAPLDRLGGLILLLVLHLGALLMAALGAGFVVERIRPGRGIQAMWFTAVLSPLLFDGFWVIAHTIAAAGAVWAVYAALRCLLDQRWRWLIVWAFGVAVAVSFRSEGLLFCGGLAFGTLVWTRRAGARTTIPLGAATLAIGLAVYKGMNLYERAVQGGSNTAAYKPTIQGGFVAGRISGFERTILSPGDAGQLGSLVVIAVAALLFGALVATRFDLLTPSSRRTLALAAAGLAVLRIFLPTELVAGMLMAGPALVAAVLLPGGAWREPMIRFVGAVAAVTFIGVIATQNREGGVGEWGGRYFHVALPLVCVLAVISFDWILAHRGQLGRVVVGSALVVSLALSVLAMRESSAGRDVAKTLTETAWTTALTTQSAHDPGGPVVVSTWVAGGRFSWQHLLDGRYLTVDNRSDFARLGRQLQFNGVPDFTVLVEPSDRSHLGQIGSGYHVTRRILLGTNGWSVDVMSRS